MNNRFTYAYSAPTPEEREEIKSIRDSYIKKEMTDLLSSISNTGSMPPGKGRFYGLTRRKRPISAVPWKCFS